MHESFPAIIPWLYITHHRLSPLAWELLMLPELASFPGRVWAWELRYTCTKPDTCGIPDPVCRAESNVHLGRPYMLWQWVTCVRGELIWGWREQKSKKNCKLCLANRDTSQTEIRRYDRIQIWHAGSRYSSAQDLSSSATIALTYASWASCWRASCCMLMSLG